MISTIGIRSTFLVLFINTLAIALVGTLQSEEKGENKEWATIEIEGVKHVSSRAIKDIYQFRTAIHDEEGKVTLRHPTAAMKLDQPNQVIRINQVLIKPCLPLRLSEEGEVLVSTIDLKLSMLASTFTWSPPKGR